MGNTGTLASAIDFPSDLAQRIATAMATDPATRFPGIIRQTQSELMDVVAAGVNAAINDWWEYQPIFKGRPIQPQTFIQQRAFTGMWDYLRKEGAEQRKQQRIAGTLHKPDKDRDQADWLREIYLKAKKALPAKEKWQRRASKGYNPAQFFAAGALMVQLKIGHKAACKLITERLDLQAALSLQRVPSRMFYCRAMRQFRNSPVGSLVTA